MAVKAASYKLAATIEAGIGARPGGPGQHQPTEVGQGKGGTIEVGIGARPGGPG